WIGFALFQVRATGTDLTSTNPFLDGQVVGRIGGTNGVVVQPEGPAALYSEQRLGAFATWAPPVLGGVASLNLAGEVDFGFGDQSYGVGGNTGGGFGADQVNLQTRRLYADFRIRPADLHEIHAVVGLQFVADGATDPARTTPDGLLRSGARLMVFGSEAAGVTVYGRVRRGWGDALRYRVGTYTLAEQAASLPDDVWLSMADLQLGPAYATSIGLHLWYLQDRSGGTGGTLGIGPTSALSELQGGPRLDLYDGLPAPEGATLDADLVWTGIDGGFNPGLDHGPAGVHGVALLHLGRVYAPVVHDDDVLGMLVDVEARWRFFRGKGSVARVEGLFSGGPGSFDQYGGVITGNSYGVVGALHNTHGTLLLFPDPRSINRMVAVIPDVSGGLLGVGAITASAAVDLVPNKVNVGVGGGHALALDGTTWGTEINARASVEPLPFLDLGVYAATVAPGAASGLDAAPWTVYGQLDWLVF
ncbi:MAG: hypothetical protein ACI8PZ_006324, partial [Myxococcota bacterium]